jgi:hypothetical protein
VSELATIFRRHGSAYRTVRGQPMVPSHRRAIQDIIRCRTEALGGHVYQCSDCRETEYRYHSCRNRHCPKCQSGTGQRWLAKQQALLLPVPYFLMTFTLPASLRQTALRNQKAVYNILFRTSAAALQKLAGDSRFVGGQIGMVGVLHTWGRNLSYHPHVHYLIPSGGLSAEGDRWLSASHNFLVPVKALSILFRAKFRDALKGTDLFAQVPKETWMQDWVVHCQPVGNGVAALRYLAPYIFRVAISNKRILRVTDEKVMFRYRPSDTDRPRTCTLTVIEFMRRFLLHVLPKGFVKVRYYGLFSPSLRHKLAIITLWLSTHKRRKAIEKSTASAHTETAADEVRCPSCGQVMRLVHVLHPRRGPPQ